MGVFTYESEFTSVIPPARLFNAFVLDADNLIPKIAPQAVKSAEILEGDGGVGTIKKINFGEGSTYSYVKHRIDGVDKDNFVYKYSVIEGDAISETIEKISYETKLIASGNGSIIKSTSHYHTNTNPNTVKPIRVAIISSITTKYTQSAQATWKQAPINPARDTMSTTKPTTKSGVWRKVSHVVLLLAIHRPPAIIGIDAKRLKRFKNPITVLLNLNDRKRMKARRGRWSGTSCPAPVTVTNVRPLYIWHRPPTYINKRTRAFEKMK